MPKTAQIRNIALDYLDGMQTAKEFRDRLILVLMDLDVHDDCKNRKPDDSIATNLAVAIEAKFRD